MMKVISLTPDQLPDELRTLTPAEEALVQVVASWGLHFRVPVHQLAVLLRRLAAGLDAVQRTAEREQSPAAAAERLLREVAS